MSTTETIELPEQTTDDEPEVLILPLVARRRAVLFPRLVSPLFLGRVASLRAVEDAMLHNTAVAVVTQRAQGELFKACHSSSFPSKVLRKKPFF